MSDDDESVKVEVGIIFFLIAVMIAGLYTASNYDPESQCEDKGNIYLPFSGSCINQTEFNNIEDNVVSSLKAHDGNSSVRTGYLSAKTGVEDYDILGVSEISDKYGCYGVETGLFSGYYMCTLQEVDAS